MPGRGKKAKLTPEQEQFFDRTTIQEDVHIKDFAIASSINGIAIGDLDGIVTYVNKAALDMWGTHDPFDIIGKPATVFAQSEEEAARIMQTVLDTGQWTGEIQGKIMDGSPITVHLSASLVRNEEGEPVCMMCSFIDVTDRRKIESELRIKENAIASSLVGIGIGDMEGNIIYVNEAALNMWGAEDPSEVIGKSPLEFAESEEEALHAFNEFMKTGKWAGEMTGRKKDGSPITVHISANMVYDDHGNPVCTMDSFVDITDRKRMEEELKIKDLAIASSIDGIGISDLEGNIIYVNEAALRMWGGEDIAEAEGMTVLDLAQSEDEALKVYTTVLEKGGWSGEITGKRKDGTPVTVHLSASLVKNEKGEPICMMDSFVDITDRKRMEEDLRIRDFAITSSINGIAIGDMEGNITYVNDAFLRLWGGEYPSEVLGKSALTFAQSQDEAERIFRELLEKGSWVGEIIAKRKDGRPMAVQLSANTVTDHDGRPLCLMCSFVDVTERKITEQKLQQAYETLEQRVLERTEELLRANIRLQREIDERKQAEKTLIQKEEELRLESLNLEEANTAMKVLLKRGEQDKNELEEKVLSNIRELALPYVEKLRTTALDDKQLTFVQLLESTLNDIASPFLRRLSSHYLNFTPTEIQVATLIREGKTTKNIGEILNISERAVEFHRNNIRDKLGLKNKKTNLRSYLLTLS